MKKIFKSFVFLLFLMPLFLSGCFFLDNNNSNNNNNNNNNQNNTTIKITQIRINTQTLKINVGESYTFTYYPTPQNANEKVELKAVDNSFVSINRGKITALKSGETQVYVQTESGLKSFCTVYIYDFQKVSPLTLDNWSDPAYFRTQTAELSDIKFWFETCYTDLNPHVNYTITAKKTYCRFSGSYEFKINYKIYGPQNTVVKSGTITTQSFSVGETTKITGNIYLSNNIQPTTGTYRIELSAVAW